MSVSTVAELAARADSVGPRRSSPVPARAAAPAARRAALPADRGPAAGAAAAGAVVAGSTRGETSDCVSCSRLLLLCSATDDLRWCRVFWCRLVYVTMLLSYLRLCWILTFCLARCLCFLFVAHSRCCASSTGRSCVSPQRQRSRRVWRWRCWLRRTRPPARSGALNPLFRQASCRFVLSHSPIPRTDALLCADALLLC